MSGSRPPKKPAEKKKKKPASTRAPDVGARPSNQRLHDPLAGYAPFEGGMAPVNARRFATETTFQHDKETPARRYVTAFVNREAETDLNPDDYDVPSAYRQHLESQRLDNDFGIDPRIEEEMQARYVPQPPDVMEQFRRDLHNRDFQRSTRETVLVSTRRLPEVERAEQLEAEREARERNLDDAFVEHGADADNPDFFARGPEYVGGVQELGSRGPTRQSVKRARTTTLNLVTQLDAEIEQLDEDNEEEGERIVYLREERDELLKRLQEDEAEARAKEKADADESESGGEQSAQRETRHEDDGESGHRVITVPEARQLLSINCLHSLPPSMRGDFLALNEPAAVFCLLQGYVNQYEEHRQHVNVIELVKAMVLCGAKYDGFARVAVRTHLGDVLDRTFFAPFIEHNGRLCGAHEHYDEKSRLTRLIVLKFYLVRSNKKNHSVVCGTLDAEKERINFRTRDARDAARQRAALEERMGLNKAGLYDADLADDNDEDDGTDEHGPMHHIKYLQKEFMFCVRVVCVESVPGEPPCPERDEEVDNPSLDDEDDVYAPADDDAARQRRSGLPTILDEAAQMMSLDSDAERSMRGGAGGAPLTDSQMEEFRSESSSHVSVDHELRGSRSPHYNSNGSLVFSNTASATSARRLRSVDGVRTFLFAREAPRDAAEEDDDDDDDNRDPLDVHSDDDAEYERRFAAQSGEAPPYMPSYELKIDKTRADAVVGKWKSEEFINQYYRGVLRNVCVRAFQFYSARN